jgi:hypothetical protein
MRVQKTTSRGVGIRSQKILPLYGTLYASYHFDVYLPKKNRVLQFEFSGNSTRDNVLKNVNAMYRASFEDAKWRLFNALGGSYKFNAKLNPNSYFIYYEEIHRVQQKEKTAKRINTPTYNNAIPETMRKLDIQEYAKEKRTHKRKKHATNRKKINNTKNTKVNRTIQKAKYSSKKQSKSKLANRTGTKNKSLTKTKRKNK